MIAVATRMRAEADRVSAISLQRDICPDSAPPHEVLAGIGVIRSIGQRNPVATKPGQELAHELAVMVLSSTERQADGRAVRTIHRVDLYCSSAARATCAVALASFGAACMSQRALARVKSGAAGSLVSFTR